MELCLSLKMKDIKEEDTQEMDNIEEEDDEELETENRVSIALDLLPNTPVPRNMNQQHSNGRESSSTISEASTMKKLSFFVLKRGNSLDDDENNSTRKKLRLTKDQSAFLEKSFKESSTLNPKRKAFLAKNLNLQPRQIEVWFQNRRARTKLKRIEINSEYLRSCCEKLSEENKRLQKEIQELRTIWTNHKRLLSGLCPSCEHSDKRISAAGKHLSWPSIYPFVFNRSSERL